jgi:hypothetical protein
MVSMSDGIAESGSSCVTWLLFSAAASPTQACEKNSKTFPLLKLHFTFPSSHIPHYQRQVTVVAKSKLSLTRTSRSLFSSLSTTLAPKAAGPALVLASRATYTRTEWSIRSSTVATLQQTRVASNKDKKNKHNMPPKKVVEEKKVQLGRPGNSLNAGIVCTNMYVLCTMPLALVAN